MTQPFSFNSIGTVKSPYKEKFAVPRQPGLVTAAKGEIVLNKKHFSLNSVRELETFSHIWVIFVFHETLNQGWKECIRPPRLGGNKKVGVFASRSTYRPNPIGMSVVTLEKVEQRNKHVILHISGLDLVDKTPVIDIKPYIQYSDKLEATQNGYAENAPLKKISVNFSQSALVSIEKLENQHANLQLLITQILEQDPRPAYKKYGEDKKIYGMNLFDLNVCWQFESVEQATVTAIEKI